MRAAAQAGDHEAARRLAEAYQSAGGPGAGSTGDVFREQLQKPLEQFGKPYPEVVERATREVVTQDIPQFLGDTFTVPAKSLAHAQITPEEDAAFRDQMVDLLLTLGGGAAGKAVHSATGGAMRALARGGRGRGAVARALGMNPAPYESGGPIAGLMEGLMSRSMAGGIGAAVAASIPELLPGDIPPSQEALAGGGFATIAGPAISNEVLRRSPGLAQWALSESRGNMGQMIGMLLTAGALSAMSGDQPPPVPAAPPPQQWRTSVGPNAIPEPRWGRR